MYKYVPLLQTTQIVKQVLTAVQTNQQIIDHVEPYLEIGHINLETDKKTVKLMQESNFTSFYLDYPYFRQEPNDKKTPDWNIDPSSNIFDFISQNFNPSEMEKKTHTGIFQAITPVISRLKNGGSLKNVGEFYKNQYEYGKKEGYLRIGIRFPYSRKQGLKNTDIWEVVEIMGQDDFIFLDCRSEVPNEEILDYIKEISSSIENIRSKNPHVNIVVLNPHVTITLDGDKTTKRGIGHTISEKTGIYGYGDYMSEPERPHFSSNRKGYTIYYYDYKEDRDLRFFDSSSYLNALEKMGNDSYSTDLIQNHMDYCDFCVELNHILKELPNSDGDFNSRRSTIRRGHYFISAYLNAAGLKDKVGKKSDLGRS